MQKAMKKPVIVEFIQLRKDNIKEVYDEISVGSESKTPISDDDWFWYVNSVIESGMVLTTPESGDGTQVASIGDYIVFGYTEKLGRHYWPVKPDYFEKSYDILDT